MRFHKFCEIDNHYNEKTLNYFASAGLLDGDFVATNKIDGSNYCYYVDSFGNIRTSSRNRFLGDKENFNGSKHLNPIYMDFARDVAKAVRSYSESQRYDKILGDYTVVIVGEIYGGKYDHPDVPKMNYGSVQGRVNYCPQVDFIVFDIMLVSNSFTKDEDRDYNENPSNIYLDWDVVVDIVKNFSGFKIVDEIARGSFDQMLALNVDFQDPTYKQHNLPEIVPNYSEGLVIKPLIEKTLKSGTRVIIKFKSDKFGEKKPKNKVIDFNGDVILVNKVFCDILQYINVNRCVSVFSKIGEDEKKFQNVMRLVLEDAIKDYKKETEIDEYSKLTPDELKVFQKKVNPEVAKVVKVCINSQKNMEEC